VWEGAKDIIFTQLKSSSLFSEGLKPAVYSVKENEISGAEWGREGFAISYFKGQIRREYPIHT
jgi:hypothetical protein